MIIYPKKYFTYISPNNEKMGTKTLNSNNFILE